MTNVLNIAHRGLQSLAPENTLAAAQKALEVGADMWEFDVGVTADGELILFHDHTLTRVSDAETLFPDRAPWSTHQFTLSQLKQLDLGTKFLETCSSDQNGAAALRPEQQAALRGETVPTLREALLFTRDHSWRANVELKELPEAIAAFPVAEKVTRMIVELDLVEQVIVSSFCDAYIRQIKSVDPAVATGVLRRTPAGSDILDQVRQLHSQAYHPFYAFTNRREIEMLRRGGIDVNVWTVNDPADMGRFIEAGVTGIITDFPQILKEVISNQNVTSKPD